jgi:hypothetical protein
MLAAAASRRGTRRPRIPMFAAPAQAKERRIARPAPEPPPVIMMFLEAIERLGLDSGEIEG